MQDNVLFSAQQGTMFLGVHRKKHWHGWGLIDRHYSKAYATKHNSC